MLRLLGKLLPLIVHEIADLIKQKSERKRIEKVITDKIQENQKNENS